MYLRIPAMALNFDVDNSSMMQHFRTKMDAPKGQQYKLLFIQHVPNIYY